MTFYPSNREWVAVFWPDNKSLEEQAWWKQPLWTSGATPGPTYGALVAALRPAMRAALLLGYQVDSINYGAGLGVAEAKTWWTIDRDTLEWRESEAKSPAKTHKGPNVWLGLTEIPDLVGEVDGTYAVPFTFDVLGTDAFEPVAFMSAVASGVGALVNAAVTMLAPHSPDLPRDSQQGLLWIFDLDQFVEVGPILDGSVAPVPAAWRNNPTGFLRGQLLDDRAAHTGEATSVGHANLIFLASLVTGAWPRLFWPAMAAALQARGEAHRWLLPERRFFQSQGAPNFLDMLIELAVRGIVLIEGLCEPYEPVEPVVATSTGAEEITLSVWDGDATVVLRRATVFPGGNSHLKGSVTWDYIPGDDQQTPTVVVVAGRGVEIVHKVKPEEYRPWCLEIYRVQDDAQVQRIGAVVDTTQLLKPTVIEPYQTEYNPATMHVSTTTFPKLVAKPTVTGLILQYPIWGGQIPETTGPIAISGFPTEPPKVVELSVPAMSGTAAYSVDVHYYLLTDALGLTTGGVHVSVWASPEVAIHSNLSGMTAARGDPSAVSGSWAEAGMFVAEFWETTRKEATIRPWSRSLPITDWGVLFESSEPLVGPSFFPHVPMPTALVAAATLEYDPTTKVALTTDGSFGNPTLTPALHAFRLYGYGDTLFFDAYDVVLGFIPVVGDISDIAEAAYAWQTGLDKWGRPVPNFQLGLMTIGAAVPILSSGLLNAVADVVRAVPADSAATADHLFEAAGGSADFPLAGAQRALGVPDASRTAKVGSQQRQLSEQFLKDLGDQQDSFLRFAQRLMGDPTSGGWVTADDLLSEDGAGFLSSWLHTAYTRYLRVENVTPHEFLGLVDG